LKRALTKLEAKAPEGTGVFLVLHRQAGESLEDFDRRAERETREAKEKVGSGKSFILRINGVLRSCASWVRPSTRRPSWLGKERPSGVASGPDGC